MAAVDERWSNAVPAIVTLQNPKTGRGRVAQEAVRSVERTWAAEAESPVIDVASSFEQARYPAALMYDDVHPNAAGSSVWAQTVTSLLGADGAVASPP